MTPAIMHIITGLEIGGAEHSLLRQLLALRNGGIRLAVVSLRGRGRLTGQVEALGIEVTSLGMRDGETFPKAVWRLVRLVREWQPSLLQGWMYHGNLAASFAAATAKHPLPVVWNVRHSLQDFEREKRGTKFAIWLGKCFSASSSAIIYNSEVSCQQHIEYGYFGNSSVVIPNGFDCDLFTPSKNAYAKLRLELGVGNACRLIGMVARFHPNKDFPNFLRAAALIRRRRPETEFVLVGNGVARDNQDLFDLVSRLGLVDCVHLLGERRDVPKIIAGLDILSTSSWSEGFPNVLGEAMSCGVPCVATDVGDSAHIVGDTGVAVPPRDSEALSAGWDTILSLSIQELQQLGQAARQRVLDNFEMNAEASQYQELYQRFFDAERMGTP